MSKLLSAFGAGILQQRSIFGDVFAQGLGAFGAKIGERTGTFGARKFTAARSLRPEIA